MISSHSQKVVRKPDYVKGNIIPHWWISWAFHELTVFNYELSFYYSLRTYEVWSTLCKDAPTQV